MKPQVVEQLETTIQAGAVDVLAEVIEAPSGSRYVQVARRQRWTLVGVTRGAPGPMQENLTDILPGGPTLPYKQQLKVMPEDEHQRLLRAEEEKREELEGWRAEAIEQREKRSGEAYREIKDKVFAEIDEQAGAKPALAVAVALAAASDDRARAAESQLEEVAQELESRIRRAEEDTQLGNGGELEVDSRAQGLSEAIQLLRDKGTDMEDFSDPSESEDKSSITAHKGAERGGGGCEREISDALAAFTQQNLVQRDENESHLDGVAVEGDPGLEQIRKYCASKVGDRRIPAGASNAYLDIRNRIRELQGEG